MGVMSRVVGYFGSWCTYRKENGHFDVEDIDPFLCTHLIYAFVGINPDGTVKVLDPWNDLPDNGGKAAFRRFVGLKSKNPNLKTMIAIGGWNEGSTTFSQVMNDSTLMSNFVRSSVEFVKKYGFDGFDLDWEYPNKRGGIHADIQNFIELLKLLRVEFDKYGLLLTAAVGATRTAINKSYDVPNLSKYLDFINVMTYDLHGPWNGVTGENSPLYASSKDTTDSQKELNVKSCIESWITMGADPLKLNLGIGAYGRSFTLNNPDDNGIGSTATTPGNPGPYTKQEGMLGYNEITELLTETGWNVIWEDQQKVPYMYKGNQWVGYDTPRSVQLKVDYARQTGLGGTMIWSIETDDFRGVSGTKFPLLKAIKNAQRK